MIYGIFLEASSWNRKEEREKTFEKGNGLSPSSAYKISEAWLDSYWVLKKGGEVSDG
jgi:hypothetical protein